MRWISPLRLSGPTTPTHSSHLSPLRFRESLFFRWSNTHTNAILIAISNCFFFKFCIDNFFRLGWKYCSIHLDGEFVCEGCSNHGSESEYWVVHLSWSLDYLHIHSALLMARCALCFWVLIRHGMDYCQSRSFPCTYSFFFFWKDF